MLSEQKESDVIEHIENISELVEKRRVNEVDAFISKHLDLDEALVYQMETESAFNILKIKREQISGLVNYKKMNDHRFINKVLEAVNTKMQMGGIYICCIETKDQRKQRVLNKYTPILSYPYYVVDFFVKRVVPKLPVLKKIYFSLTKGTNRVVSYTEALGRFYSCGFKVVEIQQIGYMTWFAVKKVGMPQYDMFPTYGALVTLNRIGQGGKLFKVYKLRTMHPYSEYIQEYVFQNNSLKDGGKLKDDFRVTNWGKLFRKLWIDELPMLINWLKGEMKIVGVRPLSQHFFSLYPSDVQELRIKFKPGLVPPFYADMPVTLDEIVESERKYLQSYSKAPIRTDISYFFKAMYNIFIKKARSA
jgi:lipopolysaccharide/colanic/teichoic acid biosynthesis glycosyltransferase